MEPITIQAFTKRSIRLIDVWRYRGWHIKLYGICQHGERPGEPLIRKAKDITRQHLPLPAITTERYAQAFTILHQADLFNTVTLDWWERDNELRHRVFRSLPEKPTPFEEMTASGEAACIWELRVMSFEREAWIRHILKKAEAPDWNAYLEAQLNEEG